MKSFAMLALVVVLISSVSCGRKKTPKVERLPKPFTEAFFQDVTPMIDGSAYVFSENRLYFVRGNKAVLVKVASGTGVIPDFSDITPVFDGGAYATSYDDGAGLWYLKEGLADKVTEDSSIASTESHPPSAAALYGLYISERKKRDAAESEIASIEAQKHEPEEREDAPTF